MAIKLEIKNLYKIFGEHPQRAFKYIEQGLSKEQILEKTGLSLGVKDASLAIEEGEIFVIMGLSGSGKSTMVRLLNRLIEPTRGQVLIDGVDIAKISDAELREVRRKKIAMVFQSFALMPHMTVLDNTAFGMELAGIAAQERREKRWTPCVRWGLRITLTPIRMNFPVGCVSVLGLPARWQSTLISY